MATAVKSWRRPLAVCAVLLALPSVAGLTACGGESERRAAAAPTASPTRESSAVPRSVAITGKARDQPTTRKARARPARLTPRERRQARRLLKRLRTATSKAPRSVVTDSGVIP